MGRGRKGLIEQSERKTKVSGGLSERGAPMTHFFLPKRETKKIFVPEQAFEFMKNMNPQQLVDFFAKRRRLARQNIEWKCFWRLINILHANSGLFTCEEEKYFMRNVMS